MVMADALLIPIATWAAFALRVGEVWPEILAQRWWLLVAMPVVSLPIFAAVGLYRSMVRHLGPSFLRELAIAAACSALTMPLMVLLAQQADGFQRSAAIIYLLVVAALLGGLRSTAGGWLRASTRQGSGTLIYGAGSAGTQLVGAMAHAHDLRVVAMIDDDPALHGSTVRGVSVRGPDHIESLIARHDVGEVLLAMPSIEPDQRRRIVESLIRFPVRVRTVPDLDDLVAGRRPFDDLRLLDVDDLLGRRPVPPIERFMNEPVRDRVVLVTGAGGSIGSELCRQVAAIGPRSLILLDRSEYDLYRIERQIRGACPDLEIRAVLRDVLDQQGCREVIAEHGVTTIYHAAAYKHVPLVEDNVVDAVRNNVIGTQRLLNAAGDEGVERFVLVSTDKAVRPTSIMGATKRIAEMIIQTQAPSSMRCCMVRFGNVLDSSGSVVPLFREQIESGGPLTVTDPEMVRYFMTIPEAAQLVIQAGGMAREGEVFLLDMGAPIRIVDMARLMIRLAGRSERNDEHPGGDIEIRFTGSRPGEKLEEELLLADAADPTEHPMIHHAGEGPPSAHEVADIVADLVSSIERRDEQAARTTAMAAAMGSSHSSRVG